MKGEIERAARAIASAKSIIVTAGAGMGVDSGLPDFRGPEGFWRAYPALRGYSFQDMANPYWFEKDPQRAWGFYGHRLNLYRKTVPHLGFDILRKWCQQRDYFVFTSNVDGAFQKSGFAEHKIVECHGSIHHLQYLHGQGSIWSAVEMEVIVDEEKVLAEEPLPRKNGQLLRPNILMFGDWNWVTERSDRQQDRLRSWLQRLEMDCVVIELGAGKAIPTVRRLGEQLQRSGATLVRINPRDSDGPNDTISIPMGAKEALVSVDKKLNQFL